MLEGPGFFDEIMREGVRYGMGAFDYTPREMAAFRNYISENPDLFYEAVSHVTEGGLFALGDKYVRMQSGLSPRAKELGLENWFNFKNFYISSAILPHEAFFSPEIVNEISEKYRLVAPLYRLLLEVASYNAAETKLSETAVPVKNKVETFEW